MTAPKWVGGESFADVDWSAIETQAPEGYMPESDEPANDASVRARGDEPARSAWDMRTSDRLRELRRQGAVRCATGIAPLDEAVGGGLPVGRGLAIGAPPGGCKTTLGAQIMRDMARAGVAVAYLAIDECPSGIDSRNLQALGVPRQQADNPDEATIDLAAGELDPLPMMIVDDVTVDEVFHRLARRFPDKPRCVIIDSIQTVQTTRSGEIGSKRDRVADVVETAKRCGRSARTRAAYVLISELARGAYASKHEDDLTNDLAAFKETGAIEYAVDVALVLRDAEAPDMVRAGICKNRLGPKSTFGLAFDRTTCTLTPAELSTAGSRKQAELVAKIVELVATRPGKETTGTKSKIVEALAHALGKKNGGRFRETAFPAVDAAIASGSVVWYGQAGCFVVPGGSAPNRSPGTRDRA